jgi:hypothetical protein
MASFDFHSQSQHVSKGLTTQKTTQNEGYILKTFRAKVNQHPPVHLEGWMVSGQLLLDSNPLANHGGYLSCFLKKNYLPTSNPQAGC